jgi:hypothetical protein
MVLIWNHIQGLRIAVVVLDRGEFILHAGDAEIHNMHIF